MSSTVIDQIQCPKCAAKGRDRSHNNLAVFDDGHGYCFAGCGYFPPTKVSSLRDSLTRGSSSRIIINTSRDTLGINLRNDSLSNNIRSFSTNPEEPHPPVPPTPLSAFPGLGYNEWRRVEAETMRFFDVKSNEDVIVFPWGPKANLVRRKDRKEFWWEGQAKDSQGLFGMERFPSGSSFGVVTILEGALDAMSLYQALGSKYACVAVKSASSALADCTREFDYLNGFEKIKICLDNDQVGQEAAAKIVRLFDPLKIYWVRP